MNLDRRYTVKEIKAELDLGDWLDSEVVFQCYSDHSFCYKLDCGNGSYYELSIINEDRSGWLDVEIAREIIEAKGVFFIMLRYFPNEESLAVLTMMHNRDSNEVHDLQIKQEKYN